jgi:hypothetical protein
MKENIHVETKITMALAQLGSGNSSHMCGEANDVAKNIASITMNFFCSIIKKHLKPLVVPKLTRNKIK